MEFTPRDFRLAVGGSGNYRPANLLFFTLFTVCLVGCARQLMPTPNLYLHSTGDVFDSVSPDYRNNRVNVLYVTDRDRNKDKKYGPNYGYGRSHSLAFGSAVVEIGRDVSWDDLVQASRTAIRAITLPLSLRQVFELERFPSVPYRIVESEPRLKEDPEIVAQHEAAVEALHEELEKRLVQTDRKEVVVFIHGFNVNFEHAVFTSAELWHFMGRQGVPLCYTWPAGRGLSGRGYSYDTVSSEFTVFHLKQTLRAVARCEAVEKVHILAHSRGTAVATTALCELMAEHRHFKDSARSALKLGNVILAAPDLDYEVTQQKLGGEHVMHLPERMTVYTHPGDKALAAADILTLGMARLGNLAPMDMTENLREMLQSAPLSMIEARVSAGFIGHSYFIDSPAVSSDLILILRDNLDAGKENGRPLIERMKNFWQIRDDYLKER